MRYVHLNPVRAGLCGHPADWPWSSYRATVGLDSQPSFIAPEVFLRIDEQQLGTAQSDYAAYVESGIANAVSDTGLRPKDDEGFVVRRDRVESTAMTLTVLNPATEEPIAELEQRRSRGDRRRRRPREGRASRRGAPSPRPTAAACCAGSRRSSRSSTRTLSRLESANAGKPISGARGEIGMVAQVFHFYAGAVDKHYGETIPVAGGIDVTFREPLGVVGLITPWNFPLNIASWKIGPALATGNTIVIKPAELTPLTTLRLGELALEAGIPEGVLNVVVGKGSVVGQRLVEHPDVAKIGFTGSTEVGQRVMQGAAATIKRVTLELGGKSANIDLRRRRSREGGRLGALLGVRQRRPGLLRALAASSSSASAYDRFLELLVEATRGVKVGDPADDAHRDGAADLGRASRHRGLVRRGRAARSAATSRTGRASGSPARSSRRRTTIASRARRCSARSRP